MKCCLTLLSLFITITVNAQSFPRIGYAGLLITNVIGGKLLGPPGPVIVSGPSVTATNSGAATISWATDLVTTNDLILYSIDTDFDSLVSSLIGGTSHSLFLSGLSASTVYNFKVVSRANGLSTTSAPSAFVTYSAPTNVIIADMWQDFEILTITAANLNGSDHTGLGTWTTSTDLSMFTAPFITAEKQVISTVNGLTDLGQYGIARDLSIPTAGSFSYNLPVSLNGKPISLGFWFKTPGSIASSKRFMFVGTIGSSATMIMSYTSTRHIRFEGATVVQGSFTLSEDTWYWFTAKLQQNNTCYFRAYDSFGVQVDEITAQGQAGNTIQKVVVGEANNIGAEIGRSWMMDDLVVDWSTANYPLGP